MREGRGTVFIIRNSNIFVLSILVLRKSFRDSNWTNAFDKQESHKSENFFVDSKSVRKDKLKGLQYAGRKLRETFGVVSANLFPTARSATFQRLHMISICR